LILLSEQKFIDSPEPEFNINPLASSQLEAKHSPETLAKISEIQSSIDRTGKNNPMHGHSHSIETLAKMSEILGNENHPNFGKSLSAETKAKMSITNKGKVKPKSIKQKFI
jgi:group I intron endonuclease